LYEKEDLSFLMYIHLVSVGVDSVLVSVNSVIIGNFYVMIGNNSGMICSGVDTDL
jgi:hypothetical protein